jgi:hypothetical protein
MDDQLSRQHELERRIESLERRLASADRPTTNERPGQGAAEAAQTAFWAIMHRIFPDEARRHMKAATREQLLAARTYLDRWIESLEEGSTQSAERPHERISIE